MKEKDFYPAGAYEDPNAPYNQEEPDLIETAYDVTMYAKVKCTVFANTSYKVYDDEERECYTEQVDDHIDIVRDNIKLPDIKWHSFKEDKPELGVPILVRNNIFNHFAYRTFNSSESVVKVLENQDAEWQYINNDNYEFSVEETDIELA